MNYAGILHYADQRDCFFLEDGSLRIRLMVASSDVSAIYLHTTDKYISHDRKNTDACFRMERYASDFAHDYFRLDLRIPSVTDAANGHDNVENKADSEMKGLSIEHGLSFDMLCLRYTFEIIDHAGARIWYGDNRFFPSQPMDVEAMFDCPILSRKEQTFSIPDWAKNAVVYQIFPSRYASSEPVDPKLWYKAPIGSQENLGGNLRGIIEHLPHLKEMGVDVIYMTPIFKSNTSHKYDTVDYYQVDPSLGTAEDLHDLVKLAHELGLRVMLDGVFNHTSTDFFAFSDIKEKGKDSEYYDWYYIDSLPIDGGSADRKPSYQSFAYFGGMPKLNLHNPKVQDYVLGVACHYLKEFGIDGWRLDVGDEIGHAFWKRFRKEVKAINADALIVGEVWHYAPDFLQGDEWDSVMNYAFYKSVSSMICDGNTRPSDFMAEQGFLNGQYHSAVLPVMWNLIDSHDTSRFLYRAGEDKRKLRLAAALQMLLPGTPFLYYGDEVGMTGGMDPDNRRGMLWDPDRQDRELYTWYQRLTFFRHTINDLTSGNYSSCSADDERRILEYHLNSGEILLFHVGDNDVKAREFSGYKELLSDSVFDGILPGFSCVLLRKN